MFDEKNSVACCSINILIETEGKYQIKKKKRRTTRKEKKRISFSLSSKITKCRYICLVDSLATSIVKKKNENGRLIGKTRTSLCCCCHLGRKLFFFFFFFGDICSSSSSSSCRCLGMMISEMYNRR